MAGVDGATAASEHTKASTPPAPDTNSQTQNHESKSISTVLPDDETSASNPAISTSSAANPTTSTLSKNQQKKLKRKAAWEEGRESRKALRRTKAKARKERRRENPEAYSHWASVKRSAANITTTPVPVTFIYDCGYDGLMNENERVSLASQLTRAYSDHRKARWRPLMCVSSFGGRLKERFEGVLGGSHGNWKGVRFLEEGFVKAAEESRGWMGEVDEEWRGCETLALKDGTTETSTKTGAQEQANGKGENGTDNKQNGQDRPPLEPASPADNSSTKADTIYLTSDSPHTLTALKPHSTYIIGALVDKNRHKGACYKAAVEAGIQTAKLPIREFMQMSSRQVLATSHVGEIMLKWLDCGDWGKAFVDVIPQRKGGVLKGKKEEEDAGSGGKGGAVGDGEGEVEECRVDVSDYEHDDEYDDESAHDGDDAGGNEDGGVRLGRS